MFVGKMPQRLFRYKALLYIDEKVNYAQRISISLNVVSTSSVNPVGLVR